MELEVKGQRAITTVSEFKADYFSRFLEYIDAKPKTVETYTIALRQFYKYLQENGITRPLREDVKRWRDEELKEKKNLKPTTIQNYIIAVRIFFTWANQEGLYPNIAEHLKGAKISHEHKKDYLAPNQIKDILNSIDRTTTQGKRDYAIISLMVTCGLRTVEVERANVEDLTTLGSDTVLYIQGKGRDEKTEYEKVPAEVVTAIRDYQKTRKNNTEGTPLFTSLSNNSQDKRISRRSIRGIVKEYMVKAGYNSPKLTAHSLRHSAITISLLANKDIREVQQFARHKNMETTLIYDHALDVAKNSCGSAIAESIF